MKINNSNYESIVQSPNLKCVTSAFRSGPDPTVWFLLRLKQLVLGENTRIKETLLPGTAWMIIFLTGNQPYIGT